MKLIIISILFVISMLLNLLIGYGICKSETEYHPDNFLTLGLSIFYLVICLLITWLA